MTNKINSAFYVGFSGNLIGRIWDHRNKTYSKSFTARYNLSKLVWYENFDTPDEAISCEKKLKRWHREWKINLVRKENPLFSDLSKDWYEDDQFNQSGDSETSSE
mgnify:CR=1 FL=1